MTYAETITPIASLASGASVAGWMNNDGAPGRNFRPAGTPANGSAANYPTVAATPVAVSAVDGSFGGSGSSVTGYYKVHLTPVATDTVNASSPMEYIVPPTAVFLVATG